MAHAHLTVSTHRRMALLARQRRSFSRPFKVEVVKRITENGYSRAEAARSLSIRETLLLEAALRS